MSSHVKGKAIGIKCITSYGDNKDKNGKNDLGNQKTKVVERIGDEIGKS